MNPPRRLRGAFGMCNLREGFVNLREGFVVAPWRLREAFSKTRSAKASRSPLEGFAKAPRAPSFGNDSSDNDKPPPYHRVIPEFLGSSSCVSMAFTAESPQTQGQ